MDNISVDLIVQPQFMELYNEGWSEFALYSGRGAGKSWEVAQYVILESLKRKITILCAREIQESIRDSVKKLLSDTIDKMGVSSLFDVQRDVIYCQNESQIIFKGLRHNIQSIKSMENIGLVWIEEAQAMSFDSLNILLPTVKRVHKSKIIYTYNRTKQTDAIEIRFHNKNIPIPDKSIVRRVHTKDNIYLNDAMRQEMEFDYKYDPKMAAHTWGGELKPVGDASSVLPYDWLIQAVDAHKKLGINLKLDDEYTYLGFDVADSGDDHCAIARVCGALVQEVTEFDSAFISQSVDIVHKYAIKHKAVRIYYDAVGVGAGAKSDFNRLASRDYVAEAYIGASSPEGKDNIYIDDQKNSDYFMNQKAQSWWAIRKRLENTIRLINNEKIDHKKCLFLDGSMKNIDKLINELSQATYDHDNRKLIVDKAPNGEKSPNLADALVMAFTRSLKNGLTAK